MTSGPRLHYQIHKVVKSNDWKVHFELGPWQRSHSSRNVKVPVLVGAPCSGCPHKKTYSWLQQLGEKSIDGPTSLDQHYFLPASLFGEAFFWQGSYCSAQLPIEKTTNPHTLTPPTHHRAWHRSAAPSCKPQVFGFHVFLSKSLQARLAGLQLFNLQF